MDNKREIHNAPKTQLQYWTISFRWLHRTNGTVFYCICIVLLWLKLTTDTIIIIDPKPSMDLVVNRISIFSIAYAMEKWWNSFHLQRRMIWNWNRNNFLFLFSMSENWLLYRKCKNDDWDYCSCDIRMEHKYNNNQKKAMHEKWIRSPDTRANFRLPYPLFHTIRKHLLLSPVFGFFFTQKINNSL